LERLSLRLRVEVLQLALDIGSRIHALSIEEHRSTAKAPPNG
jgi:hypothetical protein